MEKDLSETVTLKSFLIAITVVIIALGSALLIVHSAANMHSRAKQFAERCTAENGVVVPARTGDVCIPKWIIFEENNK